MRRSVVVSAVVAFALSGCGGGSSDGGGDAGGETTSAAAEGPISVAQAKEEGGTALQIRGFVFVNEDDGWFLCNELDTGSYPPVCIEPSLKVANPKTLASVKLSKGVGQAGGLQWATVPTSLTGDVEGDAVTVSEIEQP